MQISEKLLFGHDWKTGNLEVKVEVCKCEHFCATGALVLTNVGGGKLETHLFSHRQHNPFQLRKTWTHFLKFKILHLNCQFLQTAQPNLCVLLNSWWQTIWLWVIVIGGGIAQSRWQRNNFSLTQRNIWWPQWRKNCVWPKEMYDDDKEMISGWPEEIYDDDSEEIIWDWPRGFYQLVLIAASLWQEINNSRIYRACSKLLYT